MIRHSKEAALTSAGAGTIRSLVDEGLDVATANSTSLMSRKLSGVLFVTASMVLLSSEWCGVYLGVFVVGFR